MKSFPQGATAVGKLLDLSLGRKRLERLTERIGQERIAERHLEIASVAALTLMQKIAGPSDVTPPVVCAVMADGGRVQQTQPNPDSKTHWFEYKAGLCLTLDNRNEAGSSPLSGCDPLPEVPAFLLNFEQAETLCREIGKQAAVVPEPDPTECEGEIDLENTGDLAALIRQAQAASPTPSGTNRDLPWSPRVLHRDVVATCGDHAEFGPQLVSRAWQLGFFQAESKAFVGDGGAWIWGLWERSFKAHGFVPILDFIHALTYVFAGATAGKPSSQGRDIYREWIEWVWQGRVADVILALESRQLDLGEPQETDGETSPVRIVAGALTYLRNQQSRMDYPAYRKQGLPITSSHMESAIKELNFRIKGSEKFWSESGGEAVLQLRADSLSDSDPLTHFWHRQTTRNGLHARTGKNRKQQAA